MALLHNDKHVVPSQSEWSAWARRWMDLRPDQEGSMRAEEFHEGDNLIVRLEMPGLDPDKDVEISVSSGVVTIRAHREETSEHKNKRGYRSEFRYGELVRQIALPEGASVDDIHAQYTDGILEVRLPCPESQEPVKTKVPVSRS